MTGFVIVDDQDADMQGDDEDYTDDEGEQDEDDDNDDNEWNLWADGYS